MKKKKYLICALLYCSGTTNKRLIYILIFFFLSFPALAQFTGYGSGMDGNSLPLNTVADAIRARVDLATLNSNTITVSNVSASFSNGRVVLIIDMIPSQCLNSKNWEFNQITTVSGSTINLLYPLQKTYTSAQVIQVPEYGSVTATGLTCTPWNEITHTGGVIPLMVENVLTIQTIDASFKGFLPNPTTTGTTGHVGIVGGTGGVAIGQNGNSINTGIGGVGIGGAGNGAHKNDTGQMLDPDAPNPQCCGCSSTTTNNPSNFSNKFLLMGGSGNNGAGGAGGLGAGGAGGPAPCPENGTQGGDGGNGTDGGNGGIGGGGGGIIIIKAGYIDFDTQGKILSKGADGSTGFSAPQSPVAGQGGIAPPNFGAGGGDGADGGNGGNGGNGGTGGVVFVTTSNFSQASNGHVAIGPTFSSNCILIGGNGGPGGAMGGIGGLKGENADIPPDCPQPPCPEKFCACEDVWLMMNGAVCTTDVNDPNVKHYIKILESDCRVETVNGHLSITCTDINGCVSHCDMDQEPVGSNTVNPDLYLSALCGNPQSVPPNFQGCLVTCSDINCTSPSFANTCCGPGGNYRKEPVAGNNGLPGKPGEPGGNGNAGGEDEQSPQNNSNVFFTLKLFIQGYYIGNGMMTPKGFPCVENGLPTDVDFITIKLLSSTNVPCEEVASAIAMLHTNGMCTVSFTGVPDGEYYISICYCNALSICSASKVTFIKGKPASYDFSKLISQAFGSNQVTTFDNQFAAMYSGDLNHDCVIDLLDATILEFEIQSGTIGCVCEDLNGDGYVDGFDYDILLANLLNNPVALVCCCEEAPCPNGLSASAIITNINCIQCVTITATGGTQPYKYSINGGAISQVFTFCNLTSGINNFHVEDANNCNFNFTFDVPVAENLDDGNACTIDNCNSQTGEITHTDKYTAAELDDNNLCTIDNCNSLTGQINHADKYTAAELDDNNLCTIDNCNSQNGQIIHADKYTAAELDDNNLCTIDNCNSLTGQIIHADKYTAAELDDNNLCTIDNCNSLTGLIVHQGIPDCCNPTILTSCEKGIISLCADFPDNCCAPPYTYSWSGVNGFSASTHCILVSTAGNYTVTISCGSGTTFTTSIEVNPGRNGWAVATYYSADPSDKNVKLIDTRINYQTAPKNINTTPVMISGSSWNSQNLTQVFGTTHDNAGNIFVTATTVYGPTPFTASNGGGVYRLNAVTNSVTPLCFLPNSSGTAMTRFDCGDPDMPYNSPPPGLGNICYDRFHGQLLVTNFEDGKIYRINPISGKVLGSFDPLQPDNGSPGFAPLGERLWGIGVFGNNSGDVKVYYSVWANDRGRKNSIKNSIRCVSLNINGEFNAGSDAKIIELDFIDKNCMANCYSNPVSDIEFSEKGTSMILAERTMSGDIKPYFAPDPCWAHESRVLEYSLLLSGTGWISSTTNQFNIGAFPSCLEGKNSTGGVDFGFDYFNFNNSLPHECDRTIWAMSDAVHYNTATCGAPPDYIYGLQELHSAGLNNNVGNSVLIDLDGSLGNAPKNEYGDVDIFKCCCELPPPEILTIGPTTFCSGANVTAEAPPYFLTYLWSPSSGLVTVTNYSVVASPTQSTIYTVTVSDADGCTATASFGTTVNQAPMVSLFPDMHFTICDDTSGRGIIDATASGNGLTFVWNDFLGSTKEDLTILGNDLTFIALGNPYPFHLTVTDENGCTTVTNDVLVTSSPCGAVLNLKMYIQGFYSGNGLMEGLPGQGCLNVIDAIAYPDPTDADDVTITAMDPITYMPVESHVGRLKTNGNLTVLFNKQGVLGQSFYIQVTHRNLIETWSKDPVPFLSITNYDFTTSSTQAYDDGFNPPMKLVDTNPEIWAMFNGDVDQDGGVTSLDMTLEENDSNAGAYGYNATDLNGDGGSDSLDMTIIENNGNAGVFTAHP